MKQLSDCNPALSPGSLESKLYVPFCCAELYLFSPLLQPLSKHSQFPFDIDLFSFQSHCWACFSHVLLPLGRVALASPFLPALVLHLRRPSRAMRAVNCLVWSPAPLTNVCKAFVTTIIRATVSSPRPSITDVHSSLALEALAIFALRIESWRPSLLWLWLHPWLLLGRSWPQWNRRR